MLQKGAAKRLHHHLTLEMLERMLFFSTKVAQSSEVLLLQSIKCLAEGVGGLKGVTEGVFSRKRWRNVPQSEDSKIKLSPSPPLVRMPKQKSLAVCLFHLAVKCPVELLSDSLLQKLKGGRPYPTCPTLGKIWEVSKCHSARHQIGCTRPGGSYPLYESSKSTEKGHRIWTRTVHVRQKRIVQRP